MQKFLTILTLLTTLLVTQNSFARRIPKTIAGTVEKTWIGELDPYVGKYCVIIVKDYKGNDWGLVSDEGLEGPVCDDAEVYQDKLGFAVRASKGSLERIRNKSLLTELEDLFKDEFPKAYFLKHDDHLVSIE